MGVCLVRRHGSGPRAARALAMVTLALLAVSCSESSPGTTNPDPPGNPGTPAPPDDDGVVEIQLSTPAFSPAAVTIEPGTTVRWVNSESVFHTVTPDGHSEFDRATFSQTNDTFEHTFANAGTFDYFCEPHVGQGMTGTITVSAP